MHPQAYFTNGYTLFGLAACGVMSLTAWARGGALERYAALAITVNCIVTGVIRAFSGTLITPFIMFASDFSLALLILLLALRHPRPWLGLLIVVLSLAIFSHTVEFSASTAARWHGSIVYLVLNNICSDAILAIVIWASLSNGRKLRSVAGVSRA